MAHTLAAAVAEGSPTSSGMLVVVAAAAAVEVEAVAEDEEEGVLWLPSVPVLVLVAGCSLAGAAGALEGSVEDAMAVEEAVVVAVVVVAANVGTVTVTAAAVVGMGVEAVTAVWQMDPWLPMR